MIEKDAGVEGPTEWIGEKDTLRSLLESIAREEPRRVFCIWKDEEITFAALDAAVNRVANSLVTLGVRPGDHVATMMVNGPDHIYVMLALAKLGAVWVPINIQLIGPSLTFTLAHAHPCAIIAEAGLRDLLDGLLDPSVTRLRIWRGDGPLDAGEARFEDLLTQGSANPPPFGPQPRDVISISYTSGTTGQPKGVLLTDKMFRACGLSCALIADLRDGDVVHMWEPIYHVGGSQLIALALVKKVKIALVERFSASKYWDEIRRYGVTAIHYLGGVLQILLKQPPRPDDRDHSVRVAWGGGCTAEIWREFEERFGVIIQEDFGMTETSSIATINRERRVGSAGKALPYFEVLVVDEDGNETAPGQVGEIIVREREPGLLLSGYYNNEEATRNALRDGWLHTGDLGSTDEDGFLYFIGRKKDSIRRLGENISAWEVESVLNDHPAIEESALVPVRNELGDEDLKVFIKLAEGAKEDPEGIVRWCGGRMPHYQIPRYVAFVSEFTRTPTERIKKEHLSRAVDDCWDRERAMTGFIDSLKKARAAVVA